MVWALDPESKKKHFFLKSEIKTDAAGDVFFVILWSRDFIDIPSGTVSSFTTFLAA
jgi:hypothetical protein